MSLRISWRSVVHFWDSVCEAGEFGLGRMFRRRQARQFRTPPKRKRTYQPYGESLERRELPAALSGITEYSITTGNSGAMGITSGPDGNAWFVENSTNKIAKITPTGTVTEYAIPTSNSGPYDIVAGPDGNLWFTEANTDKIGKVTTSGSFTEYTLSSMTTPHGITLGPDGNLWYAAYGSSKIGKITTGGSVTEYSTPTSGANPEDIAAGPDGNLWFSEFSLVANKIGKSTTGGSMTEYSVPSFGAGSFGIAADSSLWFSESASANKIGRLAVDGTFTEYTIPTGNSTPRGITIGPDANAWFVENSTDKIGRVTPLGEFTEYTVPTASAGLEGITVGPDGNIWVTAATSNKIIKYAWVQQTEVPTNDPSQCHQGTYSIAAIPSGASGAYGPQASPATAFVGEFGASPATGVLEFRLGPLDEGPSSGMGSVPRGGTDLGGFIDLGVPSDSLMPGG